MTIAYSNATGSLVHCQGNPARGVSTRAVTRLASRAFLASFLLEVGCGADEQGAAIGSAEHAGEDAGAGLDLLQ